MPKGDLRQHSTDVVIENERSTEQKSRPTAARGAGLNSEIDDLVLGRECETDLLSLAGIEAPTPPNHRQWISLGLFVLTAIAIIATGLVVTASSEKRSSTLVAEQIRLAQSVEGRKKLLEAWIDSHVMASRRLTQSDLVRLFVSDIASIPVGAPLPRTLLDQRPYFQTLIADFVEQNDLMRAAVIDGEGRLLLSSPGATLDIPSILKSVGKQPIGWQSAITSIRSFKRNQQNHIIDILVPLPKTQIDPQDSVEIATILVMTMSTDGIMNEVLAVPPSKIETEALYLVHQNQDHPLQIGLNGTGPNLVENAPLAEIIAGEELEFGPLVDADGQHHYALGKPIYKAEWTIVHIIDSREALKPVSQFVVISTGIGTLFVLVFGIAIATFWWHRTSRHHHELISLYRSLTSQLNRQSHLTRTITGSISDWLAVTDDEKRYIYANPAFCTALGLNIDQILGRHENDLPCPNALVPLSDDFDDLFEGEKFSEIKINGQYHFVSTMQLYLKNDKDQSIGTLTIMRDATELMHQRQQHRSALRQTIDALIHTIECRDPFLHGHTGRLRTYAIAIGRKLDLKHDELSGLALAASLSQIGKVFIPNDILTKSERHDRKETEIMRTHISHAINTLGRIDFGHPVLRFLEQMHERLDGSGYPKGLTGGEINLGGRILAVADVFCARTAPRSYRHRLSAGKALYHLANKNDRYDIKVVAALAEIVTENGEIDPAQGLDSCFLDSKVWTKIYSHSKMAHAEICE